MNGNLAYDGSFIDDSGLEYERSSLRVPMYRNGKFVELLNFEAYLKIDRFAPYTNGEGIRQFEFQILQWEVHSYSNELGAHIFFKLSDTPQPRSVCISNQKNRDFPATIVYSAIWDVYLNNEVIVTNNNGLGVGFNVTEIPPRTDTHFQKSFTIGDITVMNGSCVAMADITSEEFHAKVDEFTNLRLSLA